MLFISRLIILYGHFIVKLIKIITNLCILNYMLCICIVLKKNNINYIKLLVRLKSV